MNLLGGRHKRVAGSILAIIVAIIVYFIFIGRAEPFQYARQWANQSQEVREVLGNIEEVGTFPWRFSYRYNSEQGYAMYSFNIRGTRKESRIYVNLIKEQGRWRVVKASLGGTNISIFR